MICVVLFFLLYERNQNIKENINNNVREVIRLTPVDSIKDLKRSNQKKKKLKKKQNYF